MYLRGGGGVAEGGRLLTVSRYRKTYRSREENSLEFRKRDRERDDETLNG